MSGAKEIRGKIKSIKNTQKITKAMEMVAASKMRKAQERMASSRPYAERIQHVIGHLAQANPDFQHPLLSSVGLRGLPARGFPPAHFTDHGDPHVIQRGALCGRHRLEGIAQPFQRRLGDTPQLQRRQLRDVRILFAHRRILISASCTRSTRKKSSGRSINSFSSFRSSTADGLPVGASKSAGTGTAGPGRRGLSSTIGGGEFVATGFQDWRSAVV